MVFFAPRRPAGYHDTLGRPMNVNANQPAAKRFGRYRPLAVLGRGGMANVYLAAASGPGNFNKLVVIKELKPELADDPEFRMMFLDEARLAARLHHPNVVQTYEVLENPDQHAFVMEYLDGQAMNRVRQRLTQLGQELALGVQLRIVAELLAGLHYAHELADYDGTPLRIVHRDVSPHNVFVTYAGEVKVVDFGIAKASDSSAQTKVGIIKGKLSYMAPEQALGQAIDRRADVFAVGLILWEAATGQRIWKGMQDAAILNLLSTGNIPDIRQYAPNTPPALVDACARALAIDPAHRFATAADFLADLEAAMRLVPGVPGTRELGTLVTQAFEEERRKIRTVIEEAMREAKAVPTGEFEPEMLAQLAPHMAGTPSHSQVSKVTGTGNSQSVQFDLSAPPPPASSGPSLPGQPQSNKSPVGMAALAAGAVLAIGAVAFVGLTLHKGDVQQPIAAPSQTAAPTVDKPVAATRAMLTVNVSPKTAKTTLDGQAIPTPGPAAVPIDGASHVLKVEAQGYQPRVMNLTFAHDQTLDIALDKAGAAVVTGGGGAIKPVTSATGKPPGGNGDPDLGF